VSVYHPRMKTEMKTERITTMMTPSEVNALDDWAFANRIRSRGEAIRRLIEKGLKAEDKVPTRSRKLPNIAPSNETESSGKPVSARQGRAPRAQ
jgi:hypothetical protein